MRFLFKSAVVGFVGSIIVGIFAFSITTWFDAVGLFIAPAKLLIPIIGPLVPSSIVYSLVPEGGASAGLLLIMFCAFIFWAFIIGLTYIVLVNYFGQRHQEEN